MNLFSRSLSVMAAVAALVVPSVASAHPIFRPVARAWVAPRVVVRPWVRPVPVYRPVAPVYVAPRAYVPAPVVVGPRVWARPWAPRGWVAPHGGWRR